MRKGEKVTFLFLLPALIILVLLTIYPFFYALFISFRDIDILRDINTFVGFKNYVKIFQDETFWVSLFNTIKFVVFAVFFEFILGMIFALFFNTGFKAIKLIRALVLIPMLLPPITVALTWKMMFAYDTGILNYLLRTIHLQPIEWLSSTKWALFSIIFTDIWQWTPFVFLVVLASLQSIPLELYESAHVFGANKMQCFRYITLPLLKPGLILALLLRTIDTFRIFDKMYTLTGGGPGNATETITFYIFRHGFKYFETGYSAAASLIMVLMILIFSSGYLKRAMSTSDLR